MSDYSEAAQEAAAHNQEKRVMRKVVLAVAVLLVASIAEAQAKVPRKDSATGVVVGAVLGGIERRDPDTGELLFLEVVLEVRGSAARPSVVCAGPMIQACGRLIVGKRVAIAGVLIPVDQLDGTLDGAGSLMLLNVTKIVTR